MIKEEKQSTVKKGVRVENLLFFMEATKRK